MGIRLKKRLGQNLLVDKGYLERIAEAADLNQGDTVVEIGPGTGNLTRELAARAGRVIAVELDRGMEPLLSRVVDSFPNTQVVWGDALRVNLDDLVAAGLGCAPGGVPAYKVVGNLPYYITTPLLFHLLKSHFRLTLLVVMVQKEVAHRLVAEPGRKDYGALSVAVQFHAVPTLVLEVPRGAFLPPPAVDSAVVKIEVRQAPAVQVDDEALYFRLVRAVFGQRRKTIQNALLGCAGLGLAREEWGKILAAAGVVPGKRGETLSLAEFAALAREVEHWLEGSRSTCSL